MVSTQHIGCKVIATEWDGKKDLRGMVGHLRAISGDGKFALVEYRDYVEGCDGTDQNGKKVGKSGHCYWHKSPYVALKAMPDTYAKKVQKDYKFRGRNLKDMPFKYLGTLPGGTHAAVEFKEDVGGHSADGHGKKGQCLVLPTDVIKK
jgi:hypothetical protein